MNMHHPLLRRTFLLLPAFMFVLSGCSDVAPVVREFTYPPDFKYVSGQALRSSMDQLAYQLQLLDEALTHDASQPHMQQQQVLRALDNIERVGANLQTSDAGSTHPFLNTYMNDFRSGVRKARDTASTEPPNYYLAGKIAGGCVNCHKVNR